MSGGVTCILDHGGVFGLFLQHITDYGVIAARAILRLRHRLLTAAFAMVLVMNETHPLILE
jgi:hypothetical protein